MSGPSRTVGIVAAVGVASLALALLLARSDDDGRDTDRERAASPRDAERVAERAAPARTSPIAPSPEIGLDLATKLARVIDAGTHHAEAGTLAAAATNPPPAAAASAELPAPPRPAIHLDRPPTASEQLEYVSRVHDFLVARRDALREQLERARAERDEQAIARLERELERLDASEPVTRRRVESLTARAREAEPAVVP